MYAIDRYGLGLEKEVSADIFYNKYIPQKKDRFFCPECGEQVFWVSRGGSLPDKFSHYKRTEQTPECERRVDGYSGLTLYERVGLSVYLTVKFDNQFCLNIGFPAIGGQLLSESAQQKMKVCISGSEHRRTILVDAVRFLEDNITLVPVDFIPDSGKNFDICRFIVGIHQSHSIFLSLDEIRKNERDARYRECLVGEVIEKMKLHRYGSFFFRKRAMILGKEFLYYPVPYELFVLCVRMHELFVNRKSIEQDVFLPLYYGIMSQGLAALSLMEDNFLGNAYSLCRGVLEMYFRLLVLNDNLEAAEHYKLFVEFEVKQSCCSQKYPEEFMNLFEKRRKQEARSKVPYLHYGWLEWVEDYHDIVRQAPYSMNGIVTYLKYSMPNKKNELSELEYFYKMCHGYTHGSVQGAIYSELHYFEISIMLFYVIRNTFVMFCRKQDEEPAINGVDIIAMVDRDIIELLGQYEKRSTENFELQQRKIKN